MMYNREGGFGEKVRSYYLPGNSPAPPPAHRAYVREHQQCGGGADQFNPFVIFSPPGWWYAAGGGGGVPV